MLFDTISARDIDKYVDNDDYFIIDLRTEYEFRNGHIRGALHIPYEQLSQLSSYPRDKGYILYCSRGGTSLLAARELSQQGYQVKSVVGGFHMYMGRNVAY